ncbi:kinase-like domain-containing protein [Microdochium trichocladiopsis]|uniref:Kinase-like domain-containing protein n=1 Tax=Microdochium trichocladiopsis TaxID=1682393 RepID=A0A9P8Y930_9PEZI|nr:kinase-like domain-containing protein [Microdochium trichocladiopsis]KAH7031034.1 kinase-like domain-containing protein [Microdochium trichocladiopsis]
MSKQVDPVNASQGSTQPFTDSFLRATGVELDIDESTQSTVPFSESFLANAVAQGSRHDLDGRPGGANSPPDSQWSDDGATQRPASAIPTVRTASPTPSIIASLTKRTERRFSIADLDVPDHKGFRLLILPSKKNAFQPDPHYHKLEWTRYSLKPGARRNSTACVQCIIVNPGQEQTTYQIFKPFKCTLYFHAFTDTIHVKNTDDQPFWITKRETSGEMSYHHEVTPVTSFNADVGIWSFSTTRQGFDFEVAIYPRCCELVLPESTHMTTRSGKRLCRQVAQKLTSLCEVVEGSTVHVETAGRVEYTIERQRTAGTTKGASVFVAHVSLFRGQLVVVKSLLPPSSSNFWDWNWPNIARAWAREFHILRQLRHAFIVELMGGDARIASLFLKPIDAPDLARKKDWRYDGHCWRDGRNYFQGERLDAQRILRDMADALKYLREQRVLHNDIKPGNILYAPGGHATLVDFGLGSTGSSYRGGGGSPWYTPPELLTDGQRGFEGEVWALGVVMLYVLGALPIPDSSGGWNIGNIIQQHPHDDGRRARSKMRGWLDVVESEREALPKHSLEGIVAQMLAEFPDERIGAEELVNELDRLHL